MPTRLENIFPSINNVELGITDYKTLLKKMNICVFLVLEPPIFTQLLFCYAI
jgi:hypothetical protein